MEAAVTNKALGVEVPAERRGFVGYGSYEVTEATLRQAVTGAGYIAADYFTAADIYIGSQIGIGLQFGSMTRCDEFNRYFARMSDRPAYRRAAEIDDALMPSET